MAIATQEKSVLEQVPAAKRVSVQMARLHWKFVELAKRVAAAIAPQRIQIRQHRFGKPSMAVTRVA